jgi:hypothetical protein
MIGFKFFPLLFTLSTNLVRAAPDLRGRAASCTHDGCYTWVSATQGSAWCSSMVIILSNLKKNLFNDHPTAYLRVTKSTTVTATSTKLVTVTTTAPDVYTTETITSQGISHHSANVPYL